MPFVQVFTSLLHGLKASSETARDFVVPEDLSLPIAAKSPLRTIPETLSNRAQMQVRPVTGKRILCTFFVEARTIIGGKSRYRRLKQRSVTLSVGSVEECELAIDAVLAFALSLDGKHLATNELQGTQAAPSEPSGEQSPPEDG